MNKTSRLHELPLPGLREDNPRDFLAALGLLRLVHLMWPICETNLAWVGKEHHATLYFRKAIPDCWAEKLVVTLKELAEAKSSPIFHGDIIKAEYKVFREAVKRAIEFADSDHLLAQLPLYLYSSYSSQIGGEEGVVEPSGLSFGNGQSGKKLLLDVMQLISGLESDTFMQTLLGKASPVSAKSLRWNPVEYRPAAYRSHDPGSKQKGDETKDHPSLNVLAFFGLTFYPTVATASGSRTVGLHWKSREAFFLWPIWETPLCIDEISSFVSAYPVTWSLASGVAVAWRSKRFSSDKSLYFAPAELLH
jgi:hypothetical protein